MINASKDICVTKLHIIGIICKLNNKWDFQSHFEEIYRKSKGLKLRKWVNSLNRSLHIAHSLRISVLEEYLSEGV